MRTAAAIICLALTAAACNERPDKVATPAPPPAPEPVSIAYVCEGGAAVEARHGAQGALTLVFGQTEFPMNAAEAVSGSRWLGESLEWWVTLENGDEVGTLRRLGPDRVGNEVVARCVRPAAGGALAPDPRPAAAATEAAAACAAQDLSLRHVRTEAGAGQRWATLAFRNEGDRACMLEGHPSLSLQGEGGAVRTDLRVERIPGPYYASRDVAPVTLPSSGEAFFDLGWGEVAGEISGETEPCRAVSSVRAGPSEGAGTVRTEIEAAPCGGRVRLTPVRPTEAPEG